MTARIDGNNRSLVERIREANSNMDANFKWITTVVVIGGTLLAAISL